MISDQEFVVSSLELHLFFGRIMKEHSLFLEAGFTPKNKEQAQMADRFKAAFENILHNAIQLSSGIISNDVIRSGELVTDFTRGSEQKTQNFTAIPINQDLTVMESRLYGSDRPNITPALVESIRMLNSKTAPVLDQLIDFKTGLLNDVLSCNMFTVNYPLLIDHILREAKLYRSHLRALESGRSLEETTKSMELFWNQIMLEHALFIRGLLDPSEGELINTANTFAKEYSDLLESAKAATGSMVEMATGEALAETRKYRDFKAAGTKGIAECKIRSIILPLLADHVLREANHYIRLLEQAP